jgi:hypothetical protein
MGLGENDDIVLDSYRLARWYHQPPDLFLAMPLSQVRIHMIRTQQLARLMRAEASQGDDD